MSKVVGRKAVALLVAVAHVGVLAVLFWAMIVDGRLGCFIWASISCFLAVVVGKKIYHKVKLENLGIIQYATLVGSFVAIIMLTTIRPSYHMEHCATIIVAYFALFATIRIMLLKKNS